MELWQFLGTLHPKLVQFPLVLLLAGLLLDGAGAFWKSSRARWAGLVTTAAGTLGLLFAFICGIYAEIWAGRAGVPQHPIELHELLANVASWGFVVLFAWRILLGDNAAGGRLKWFRVYVCVGLVWYVLLALTGYLGGQLVFEYGAGGGVAHNGSAISMEDLNTLASRQTDENLRYSEWMHHVFGLMTLGLAASLLAQAIWPAQQKRLRWIVPTFLLAGGIFLFFSADLDLYKLTDPHQWRDREVQLHKSLATIMAIVGIIGLARLRKSPSPAETAANTDSTPADSGNSKLVAVMALIGGSMLFTHVHTVAPYANVAAGVYIAHVIMGLVALSIGAMRMAQEYLPRFRKELALGFAGFMLIEAVLLITYNEGLPWYIGYGRYERWGYGDPIQRRQYTVAPFGAFRAVMNVSQNEGKVFVAFHTRFEAPFDPVTKSFGNDDVTLSFDTPPRLILSEGDGDIELPLVKSVDPGAPPDPPGKELTGANFRAQAEFIKTAPFLSARLVLSVGGKRMVGYFDPWVTPRVVPVPPNELATYECPMHESVRATDDTFKELNGKCPICGMDLIKIKPRRPAGEMADPGYAIVTDIQNAADRARGATIRLMIHKGNDADVPLAVMHEQLMHVVIVSEDLTYFDHLHPRVEPVKTEKGENSTFYDIEYTFPRAGRYVLFSDFTPVGDRQQIIRVPLEVDEKGVQADRAPASIPAALRVDEGSKLVTPIAAPRTPLDSVPYDLALVAKPAPLAPMAAPMVVAAGSALTAPAEPVLAELVTQPRTIYAGLHTALRFRLTDASGRPINDLVPYLAAAGHCVIVSEDTQVMLHCHPEDVMGVGADWRGGPEVTFGVEFPKAGRYRVWAQFKRGENLIDVPFMVEVHEPPVPAGLIRVLLNEP